MTERQISEATPPLETLWADGDRLLAYRQFGRLDGVPIVLCHGFPGTGADFASWDDALAHQGLRGIAIDRPGQGRSDRLVGRTLLDWPADVIAVLDLLDIAQATILGVSGGGPHALVCAWSAPHRFPRSILMNSGAPMDTPRHAYGMSLANRVAYLIAHWAPAVVRLQVWLQDMMVRRLPGLALRSLHHGLGETDRAVVDGLTNDLIFAGLRTATTHGRGGVVDEFRLHARPWGFTPWDVRTPVTIWHGGSDRLAPPGAIQWLAGQLPHARLNELPGLGHLLDTDQVVLDRVLADAVLGR